MSQWWVGRRGADPVGPVSTETLVRGVKEKKVPPNALVCRVGEQQWLHVSQVDELWDKINPEEAPTAVTEKPWFKQADSSPPAENPAQAEPAPAAEKLADADDDDDATRIYDGKSLMNRRAPEATQQEVATESPTVPLVTATTSQNNSSDAATHAPRSISKIAPVKTAAPSFRAPASLTHKAESRESGSTAASGAGSGNKEVVKAPKAVIPAPRFGVDRVVPASPPIAAGEFISKPPSVRPEPMPAPAAMPAIPAHNAPRVAQQSASRARQPDEAVQRASTQAARQTADPAQPAPAQAARQTADPAQPVPTQSAPVQPLRRTADPAQPAPMQAARQTAEPTAQPAPAQTTRRAAETAQHTPAQTARRITDTGQQRAVRPAQASSAQPAAPRAAQNSASPAQPAETRAATQNAPRQPQQAAPRPGQSSPPPAQQQVPRPGQSSAPPAQQQVPRPASNPPTQQAVPRPGQSTPAAARQTGAGQTRQVSASNGAKPASADKSRQQPIPPVPAAHIPLPPDSDIAAMVRDNIDVSLVETRPDRRLPTGSREAISQPPPAMQHELSKASPVKSEASQRAGHSTAGAPVAEHPPIVVRPIVNVAEPDDDDATVIRNAPVAPTSLAEADDDDITIAREVPSLPPESANEDEDATVIKQVNPLPAVASLDELSTKAAAATPVLSDLERLAARSADANRSGERPIAPAAEHHAPVPPPPPAPPVVVAAVASAPAAHRPAADVGPNDLYDADDDALPARAKDYAGAHDPPATPGANRPRPAAGTPLPPSVIIAPHQQPITQQHHVPIDALGRVVQPHSELTHPALRTIRPPGTIQISIASLIVGAMTIIVIVLATVLLLR